MPSLALFLAGASLTEDDLLDIVTVLCKSLAAVVDEAGAVAIVPDTHTEQAPAVLQELQRSYPSLMVTACSFEGGFVPSLKSSNLLTQGVWQRDTLDSFFLEGGDAARLFSSPC